MGTNAPEPEQSEPKQRSRRHRRGRRKSGSADIHSQNDSLSNISRQRSPKAPGSVASVHSEGCLTWHTDLGSCIHKMLKEDNCPSLTDVPLKELCDYLVSNADDLQNKPRPTDHLQVLQNGKDHPQSSTGVTDWWITLCQYYGCEPFVTTEGLAHETRPKLVRLLQRLIDNRERIESAFKLRSIMTRPLVRLMDRIALQKNLQWRLLGSHWPEEMFDPTIMMLNADRAISGGRFIMVSVDLELHERNSGFITEIGLSIIKSLTGSPSLVPDIQTFHIVISENSKKTRNGKWVPDHRDFSTQAVSVMLARDERYAYVQDIISRYEALASVARVPFFYVGHGVAGDLKALCRDQYYLPVHPVLDTSTIWTYPLTHQISLKNVLHDLRLQQQFLHNGANDAFATLLALLRMCDPSYRAQNKLAPLSTLIEMHDELREREMAYRTAAREQKITLKYASTSLPTNQKLSADYCYQGGYPAIYSVHAIEQPWVDASQCSEVFAIRNLSIS